MMTLKKQTVGGYGGGQICALSAHGKSPGQWDASIKEFVPVQLVNETQQCFSPGSYKTGQIHLPAVQHQAAVQKEYCNQVHYIGGKWGSEHRQ